MSPTVPPPGNNSNNKRPKLEQQQQQSSAGLGEPDVAPVHVTTTASTASDGDLMQRLQSFLPQLQAANQALLGATTTATLDVNLEQEASSSSDDDDDDDNESEDNDDDDNGSEANTDGEGVQIIVPKKRRLNKKKNYAGIQEVLSDGRVGGGSRAAADDDDNNHDDHDNAGATGPTIQLQFALGDMTHNPMMELLQASGEAAEENEEEDSTVGESRGDDVGLGANSSDRIGAVAKLLQRSQKEEETKVPPAVSITHTVAAVMEGPGGNSSKRPLITEL